jgi:hypothetical protein
MKKIKTRLNPEYVKATKVKKYSVGALWHYADEYRERTVDEETLKQIKNKTYLQHIQEKEKGELKFKKRLIKVVEIYEEKKPKQNKPKKEVK